MRIEEKGKRLEIFCRFYGQNSELKNSCPYFHWGNSCKMSLLFTLIAQINHIVFASSFQHFHKELVIFFFFHQIGSVSFIFIAQVIPII